MVWMISTVAYHGVFGRTISHKAAVLKGILSS